MGEGIGVEMMYYQQMGNSSYMDSLKVLEADIQYANALAAEIPNTKGGVRLQMKLVYNHLTSLFLFLLPWVNSSCMHIFPRYLNLFDILVYKVYADGRPKISTHGRKATVRDFYAVILPSLQRIHNDFTELNSINNDNHGLRSNTKTRLERDIRDEECGICLESCTKMVLPNCCHEMCINCYHDWNARSESCPFCRGTIRRVESRDLWVLTCKDDIVDPQTVYREDLLRFYRYIRNLPKDSPDAFFLMYYEYLI